MTDTNLVLHPTLARAITRHVINRSIAGEILHAMIERRNFDEQKFLYWRQEHIEASAALRKLGINVPSFDTTVRLTGGAS